VILGRLIQLSLAQRWLVILAALVIGVAGFNAARNLPIDAFPDISPTQVKVILKAPGMTPEEVESQIVTQLEAELLGIPRQTMLRSMVKYAISDTTIDFEPGVDIYWARQQVAERLANVRDALPPTVSGGLAPISTPLSDVIMFTIEGGGLDLEQRRSLLDWTFRPALRGLPGVADVNVLGGRTRTFEVVPDPGALAQVGLTIDSLASAIGAANRNDGAGRLKQGDQALIVRGVGAIQTLDDLRETIVHTATGQPVRVGDVAEVRFGALTRYGSVTKDGQEATQAIVLTLRGADASAVIHAVEARLEELKSSLPPGVELKVFYDRSELIERAVGTVVKALLEATLFVVVLLFLFLGNVRAAVAVAVTLPFAVLMTMLCMSAMGLSANLMSLGGLAIAIGMLVDGAVVVVENAVERLAHGPKEESKPHAVGHAALEVATPVTAGVIIICLVFMPLLALQGLEGKMFAPVALTIVFALASSLVLSLTLIPALSSYLLRQGPVKPAWLMQKIDPLYERLLTAALARPQAVYVVAGLSVVAAAFAYMGTGKSFMPTMDEGGIIVQVAKLPTINLDRSTEVDAAIQTAVLKAVPEVLNVI